MQQPGLHKVLARIVWFGISYELAQHIIEFIYLGIAHMHTHICMYACKIYMATHFTNKAGVANKN